MNSILQRIQLIAEKEGLSVTKLEQKIGASKGVLSRALAQNSDIQSKWILKLAENYPHYSCEWLIKGAGPMIASEDLDMREITETEINYKELAEARKETIDILKKLVNYLEEKRD